MSSQAPPDLPQVALDAYKNWKPEHQQRALELLKQYETSDWKPFYCPDPTCDGHPHESWDFEHARLDQQ